MISDEELVEKVGAAKRRPNYLELAKVAIRSSSPTNAANKAAEEGYSLEEQQDARWMRMHIERHLFNDPNLLRLFLETIKRPKKTADGGTKVTANKESLRVGYLENLGSRLLSYCLPLCIFSIATTIVAASLLIRTTAGIKVDGFNFNIFLGLGSVLLLCYFLIPILLGFGVRRMTMGNYRTYLPADVFTVESAYRKDADIFVVVSGTSERYPGFVLLRPSAEKCEIIGFPERAIGPGEFYLEVEDHETHASGTKRGSWHEKSRKWRTCTFIPVEVNAAV